MGLTSGRFHHLILATGRWWWRWWKCRWLETRSSPPASSRGRTHEDFEPVGPLDLHPEIVERLITHIATTLRQNYGDAGGIDALWNYSRSYGPNARRIIIQAARHDQCQSIRHDRRGRSA